MKRERDSKTVHEERDEGFADERRDTRRRGSRHGQTEASETTEPVFRRPSIAQPMARPGRGSGDAGNGVAAAQAGLAIIASQAERKRVPSEDETPKSARRDTPPGNESLAPRRIPAVAMGDLFRCL